jgi:non-ribosomal peptide synthase protein (TIGR01720 family)
MATYPAVQQALVLKRQGVEGQACLYAYYVGEERVTGGAWRNFLAAKLPYYMIPVKFHHLDYMPLTRNGKIDTEALPEPDPEMSPGQNLASEESSHSDREIQTLMIHIWEEVLCRKNLSVTDNFFEMGGDSIKAIQIVSRLAEKKFFLQVKDILTYQIIEAVCLRVKSMQERHVYEQGIIEGNRRLTPVETWFFGQCFRNVNYYNQSVLFDLAGHADLLLLTRAFGEVIAHHDGLRMNYDPIGKRMYCNNLHLQEEFVLSKFTITPGGPKLAEIGASFKKGFDITHTLLLKAAVIESSNEKAMQLLITAHHLVIDGISWRILLEDLLTAYEMLMREDPVRLPAKTASVLDMAGQLGSAAGSQETNLHERYWAALDPTTPILSGTSVWRTGISEKTGIIKEMLDREKTAFLLRETYLPYRSEVPVLLNAALVLMLQELSGRNRFVIEHEHHGRHPEGIDTSRTIGWFTTIFPVELTTEKGGIGELILSVKERMEMSADRGIDHMLYRSSRGWHSKPAGNDKLTALRFNYLGRFGSEFDNPLLTYSDSGTGSDSDPENEVTARLEFNFCVIKEALQLEIRYDRSFFDEPAVIRVKTSFFNHLGRVLDHVAAAAATDASLPQSDIYLLASGELDQLFR